MEEKTFTLDTIYDAARIFFNNCRVAAILDEYGEEETAKYFKEFLCDSYYPGMKVYRIEFWRKKKPNVNYEENGYRSFELTETHYLVTYCKVSDRELEKIKDNPSLKEKHFKNSDGVYYEIFDDEDLWRSIEGI